jgi:hypothetical protein
LLSTGVCALTGLSLIIFANQTNTLAMSAICMATQFLKTATYDRSSPATSAQIDLVRSWVEGE